MKAAVLTEWNHIELQDLPMPEIGVGECLIRVTCAGVCGSDLHIYEGHHPTAVTPLVLGHEFVGVVEAIHPQTPTDVTAGDRVVVYPLISCGLCEACQQGNWHVCRDLKLLGIHTNGAFAQYVKVAAGKVIKVSHALPDRIAALTEPFAVGFHVNRRAGLKNGDTALVIGGGPIGLIVGMVARVGGAAQVVFSEINPARVELIQELGFTAVNPAEEDALARIRELSDDVGFDVVFEVSGSHSGLALVTQACRIRGTIVTVGFPSRKPELDVLQVIFKELTVVGSRVYTLSDFRKTVKMLENITAGNLFELHKLVSDTRTLDDLETALRIMKEGKNRGKILIA
jgi:2-desacetyl-2-hydroxyethyl bacteriochlorophyllide A dehydrogenase